MVGNSKANTKNATNQETKKASGRGASPGRRSPSRRASPARRASPTRGASPGRKTSPGRRTSPARKASPSRKTSPGRPKRTTVTPASPPKITVTKRSSTRTRREKSDVDTEKAVTKPKIILVDSDSESASEKEERKLDNPLKAVWNRSRKIEVNHEVTDLTSEANDDITHNIIKRVTRSQNKEIERVVHLKHFDTIAKKLGEFSDEDDTIGKSSQLYSKSSQTPYEFGGWIGSLIMIIFMIFSIVGLYIVCDENECNFTRLPNFGKLKSYNYKLQLETFAYFLLVGCLLAIIQALPIGGKKVLGSPDKHGKFIYVLNGPFTALILFVIVFALQARDYDVAGYITDNILYFLIAALVTSTLYSVWLYVNSYLGPVSALNSHVAWKNPVYAFFMGRQLNPKLLGTVDLKMYALRFAIIITGLINYAYVYRVISPSIRTETGEISLKTINLPPTLITYFLLNTVYLLDPLLNEAAWLTSFEIQQEGFGFMGCVGYAIYPFMAGSVIRYIVHYNVSLATWKLLLIALVFSLGYVLFRGSNNQKAAFRQNPYSPALAHLENIPTGQGKKLLVSGFWGIVRHPNYLGDILMNLSWVPFVLCAPPVLTLYSIVLLLIHRSIRDNARCKQKYGSAWDRYCSRVKYVLVPKVY